MTAPTISPVASEVLSDRATLRLCTAGSVDDGKSTFVGRLLHDTKSVLADQMASVERTSADRGFEGLDLSLLVDGLRAEREQGITIDVAYRYFATDKRTFILADTPGHEQYTRNTVTGMSTSQVVVLLVDARNGIKPQTVRHLTVASLLGVKTVILAVNKIDLVDYSEEVFDGIRTEFEQRAAALGIAEPHAVPISALKGDNVVERSEETPWYEGPSVLELLETIPVHSGRALDLPFRFNIQYVLREHATDYRAYAGTVNAGTISVGDTVTAPNGRSTTVTHIDNADGLDGVTTANAGDAVALRLADDIDLARGDLLAAAPYPESVREFGGTVVGLTDKDITAGKAVKLRYGTSLVRARVASVDRVLDIDGTPENNSDVTAPESFGLNDIAHVTIQTAQELPVEEYAARGAVGNFLLIDQASGNTLAAGLVGTRLR
ncbi:MULTISPECIES: sulfate adenylyltransferase subunit 1 [unclassified Corynebacterium]|uniref:sulfate adenylyltransferase subunit 1 n=1 Tax=unclassified Corynebacterium TaxID=2624378 RepID=UPI0021A9C06E|nr:MULTISPECIES: GTP-binding protein [unclassified Corynebacterium]MCT1452088.1 GTP-binding protein [Corynebacterium sp. p3-SID1145]MCT1461790.1 GTP-binding protein [Corynebacterium sp. p3-SID1140]MDN8595197.1 GTP-binding protein [Corynebacterium sp. P4_F2]WKK55326.1 GTP-binding protein [Corynebacterium sp. P4-C1]WKK62735.1 GTP-binding protein [Corynebacterium sp. P8-C1]